MVLSIHNLSKQYGRVQAVQGLSLNIRRGSVFGILGPNGSGKTTTLGMLLGVIRPTSGTFSWFGEAPSPASRRRIGAILEQPVFYPYLNAIKNLQVIARIKQAPLENMEGVLRQVGLWERREHAFKTYSLGMKQRLAIAAALLADPDVVVLDEPTNGLDPQGIAEIRALIQQIAGEGKTIIMASHLLDEVQKVCTEFCVLKQGKLIYTGSVAEVSEGTATVEVQAEAENLEKVLKSHPKVENVQREGELFQVVLQESGSATELNAYLFEQGITASHLRTRHKSLEKKFLELLDRPEHA